MRGERGTWEAAVAEFVCFQGSIKSVAFTITAYLILILLFSLPVGLFGKNMGRAVCLSGLCPLPTSCWQ